MERLFHVKLEEPQETSRGGISLRYRQPGAKEALDVSSAGRGFLQMLLVFSYLYSHKRSVLLVDEPDAHLEILRQKQVYVLLRDIATQNGSQVVIVTHSEVILEESLDKNLTLLIDGKSDNIAKKSDIKNSLKHFGADHYIKARERGYVLYVEGGTDVDILRALAEKLNHPAAASWDERINSFYVQNNYPLQDTNAELERVEGGFGITPKDHFKGLQGLLPKLKGLAILDNDGQGRADHELGDLKFRYWRRYEIENYFITPDTLREFANERMPSDDLLIGNLAIKVENSLKATVLEKVFAASSEDFDAWWNSTPDAKRLIWEAKTERLKLSSFAEAFFKRLSEEANYPILLRKGEFHRLVPNAKLTGSALSEINSKLDDLNAIFESAGPQP